MGVSQVINKLCNHFTIEKENNYINQLDIIFIVCNL